MIPDYVTAALVAWHNAAIKCDPANPKPADLLRAQAAWKDVEEQCLRWEHEGRARRAARERTGTD